MAYNFNKLIRDTEPAAEPVTLAEAKSQLKVEHTVDDAYITALISVARDRVERFCNRYLAEANAVLIFSSFPSGKIPFDLLYPDITAINSFTYVDTDNATQTIDVNDITLDSERGWIIYNTDWPTDVISLKINVTMGKDASAVSPAEPIADSLKQAILLYVTDLYEIRGDTIVGTIVTKNIAAEALSYPYRFNIGI